MHSKTIRVQLREGPHFVLFIESAVTPTVIIAHSLISSTLCASAFIEIILYNLFRRKKKGHEWPRLMIISASKADNKKKMAQICCL